MSNDIAARLRDIEGGYGFRAICREAAAEIERLRDEVNRLRAGGCARGQTTTQFCAEAEMLRSERDEARRRVCTMSLQLGQVYRRVGGQSVRVTTPEAVAEMMGWRCFEDIAARCGIGGAVSHTAGPTETFIPEAL